MEKVILFVRLDSDGGDGTPPRYSAWSPDISQDTTAWASGRPVKSVSFSGNSLAGLVANVVTFLQGKGRHGMMRLSKINFGGGKNDH